MLNETSRNRFDNILDAQIASLPGDIKNLLEEVPLIVEDKPFDKLLKDMGINRSDTDLCGLHWAVSITEKSVSRGAEMPGRMMLFRGPIMRVGARKSGGRLSLASLEQQIHITLLHEIGHHFGLNEQDLRVLGYG